MTEKNTSYICQGCGEKVSRKDATPLLEYHTLCFLCYTLRIQAIRGANEKSV